MIAAVRARPIAADAAAPADGAGDGADAASSPVDEDAARALRTAALARKQRDFDFATQERAEHERELEALDTLLLAQLKHDDEMMKGWIRLI